MYKRRGQKTTLNQGKRLLSKELVKRSLKIRVLLSDLPTHSRCSISTSSIELQTCFLSLDIGGHPCLTLSKNSSLSFLKLPAPLIYSFGLKVHEVLFSHHLETQLLCREQPQNLFQPKNRKSSDVRIVWGCGPERGWEERKRAGSTRKQGHRRGRWLPPSAQDTAGIIGRPAHQDCGRVWMPCYVWS